MWGWSELSWPRVGCIGSLLCTPYSVFKFMHMHEYSVAPSLEVATSLSSYRLEWPHCEIWGSHSGVAESDITCQEAWIFNNGHSVWLYLSNNPTDSHIPLSFISLRDATTFKRQNIFKSILSFNDSCRCSRKSVKLK